MVGRLAIVPLIIATIACSSVLSQIRWKSNDPCCRDFMHQGSLVTSFRSETVNYTVSLHPDIDKKYIVALIVFGSNDTAYTVDPQTFIMTVEGKSYLSLHYEDVAKDMEKRRKTLRTLRGIFGGMATRTIESDSTFSGTVAGSDGSSARVTGESTTTSRVPDYAARESVRQRNAAEKASNLSRANSVRQLALKAHTLFPQETVMGLVFFRKVGGPGAILSFKIGDTVYEVPYGSERK